MTSDTEKLDQETLTNQSIISLRKPTVTDGSAVHALIARCAPLDTNSMYCNLLQCFHFADTAVVAEMNGQPVGFISGYRLPQKTDTLFVWQVAVDKNARGQGLASRMLQALIEQQGGEVQHLHTTITKDNEASWNTFRRLARDLNAPLNSHELFNKDEHLGGEHDSEFLIDIGPFDQTHQE